MHFEIFHFMYGALLEFIFQGKGQRKKRKAADDAIASLYALKEYYVKMYSMNKLHQATFHHLFFR